MKALAVGIFGLGYGRTVLLPAILRNSDYEIVGLANSSGVEKGENFSDKSFAISKSEVLLMHRGLNLAVIATPPKAHIQLIKSAQERGLNVLCEKPVGLSLEDLRQLAPTGFYAGYQFRFNPIIQSTLRFIESEPQGHLEVETIWRTSGGHRLIGEPEKSDVLYNFGSHVIDYFFLISAARSTSLEKVQRSPSVCHPGNQFENFCVSFALYFGNFVAKSTICRLTDGEQFHEITSRGNRSSFQARHNYPFGSGDYVFSGSIGPLTTSFSQRPVFQDIQDERVIDEYLQFAEIANDIRGDRPSPTLARLEDAVNVHSVLAQLKKGPSL